MTVQRVVVQNARGESYPDVLRRTGQFGVNPTDSDAAAVGKVNADAAASAASAEAAAGPTYASTAAGLAATTSGESFAVNPGDGTVAIYLNNAGTAVLQRSLNTTQALNGPTGAQRVGFKRPGLSRARARPTEDKLTDLPHIYDIITEPYRNLSYDATDDLNEALNSGERFLLPNEEIRFSGGLLMTTNNGGFIGKGKGSRLVTTAATGDIFTIGNGTDEISGVRFEGFSVFSTVTRTSGAVFNCRKITDAEFLYLRLGSRDDDTAFGNRLYDGYYLDRFSDIDIYGGEIVGQNELVRMRGNLNQSIGAECSMGGGILLYKGTNQIHVGGGCGGVKLESMDASAGQVALLIDETLQPGAFNREVITSPACSFDSYSVAGIVIDQPTASVARFLFRGTWVCGGQGGAHGIWVKNANEARVLVTAHLYGNGGDGLRIDNANPTEIANAYVVMTGESDLNGGYGINATVATDRLRVTPNYYPLGNGAGAFNETFNPFVYDLRDAIPRLPAKTVANGPNKLPVASSATADCICFVTDSSVTTPGAVLAGGGTSRVFVKCDGANWRIIS